MRPADQGRLYPEPIAADDFRRSHPPHPCQCVLACPDGALIERLLRYRPWSWAGRLAAGTSRRGPQARRAIASASRPSLVCASHTYSGDIDCITMSLRYELSSLRSDDHDGPEDRWEHRYSWTKNKRSRFVRWTRPRIFRCTTIS